MTAYSVIFLPEERLQKPDDKLCSCKEKLTTKPSRGQILDELLPWSAEPPVLLHAFHVGKMGSGQSSLPRRRLLATAHRPLVRVPNPLPLPQVRRGTCLVPTPHFPKGTLFIGAKYNSCSAPHKYPSWAWSAFDLFLGVSLASLFLCAPC